MPNRSRAFACLIPIALGLLAGCATNSSGSAGRGEEPAATDTPERTKEATPPEPRETASRQMREEEAPAQRESRSAAPTRAERAAARSVQAASAGSGSTDISRMVEQLREAARELAALRAANARLKGERERAEQAVRNAADSDEIRRAREKAASELRAANAELAKLKENLDRLAEDAAVEKRLRQEAETTAAQLREQLRTLARAVNELAADPGGEDRRNRD